MRHVVQQCLSSVPPKMCLSKKLSPCICQEITHVSLVQKKTIPADQLSKLTVLY